MTDKAEGLLGVDQEKSTARTTDLHSGSVPSLEELLDEYEDATRMLPALRNDSTIAERAEDWGTAKLQ